MCSPNPSIPRHPLPSICLGASAHRTGCPGASEGHVAVLLSPNAALLSEFGVDLGHQGMTQWGPFTLAGVAPWGSPRSSHLGS